MSTTFANSIDSNPIYADRAENDKDGNRIDQTYAKSASLATVATTGAYSDLSGTPSIPTKTSDLTNDSNFITLADVPAQVQSDWTESDSSDPSYIANKPTLAAVATSGDYADLSGTPTINNVPAVTSSDDAKVLTASYTGGVGSYTWDSLPANSAVFTVDVDSYADILSAYNAGKICFAQPAGSKYLYPLTQANIDGGAFSFWLDFTPAATFDTNQGIAERTRYTIASGGSGWITTKEKVAPYILAASRIATDLNTATKVLSVSANIPVITSGNDKVIDIADTGRIEVASSAFSGTATKTDTFTRDGYSFYTSDGSRLIGNKWTPFTSYMSGSYTVSFSGGDASRNLTFTSAGAYTWDDNTLADPSTFPDSATIHYGLFQGELSANNRMTVNPTLIGNLISDVANVTSADSSVSATVTRPENVSMTINVVAGKKLLTAFYVQFSGVTYFLSTTQNPFNKPSILISQQIGNIAKVVEEAPVDTKSYVRKDGAWVEESGGGGGSTYTAGDGIDITNNEISAKIGDGLEFGTGSRPVTITAHAVGASTPDETWTAFVQPLDADLVSAIETHGITYTMADLIDNDNVTQPWTYYGLAAYDNKMYPAICYQRNGSVVTGDRLVLSNTGLAFSAGNGTVPAGTQFDFNLNDINTDQSTIVNWSTIRNNPSYYGLCILYTGYDIRVPLAVTTGNITTGVLYDAGTLSMMESVSDAIVVSNPLPASTSSDANKVLKVNASGEPEWATGGGGSQVQSDWAEADSSDPAFIQNKPTPKTLTAGQGISIADGVNTLTISANVTVPVQDVTVDGTSVVSNGVAAITSPTIPTVDQTYDASSANAQSGVAVADAIGNLPTNLTSAQILALKEALGCDETVLYYNASGAVGTAAVNLSESIYNFERVRIDLCSKVHANNWVSTVEAPIQYITNNYLNFCFTERFDNTWRWITWRCDYPITNSGTTITLESTAYGGALENGNWSSGVNVNTNFHLYKVVGIHRVASN